MAKRPKLNLSGSHFKDSYIAEVECLEAKTSLIREIMDLLMDTEVQENNNVKGYLEKSYRLLNEQLQGAWKLQ
jgi:hypothetical protein